MASEKRRVLVVIEPPLLADLIRRSLESAEIAVDVGASTMTAGTWDVVILERGAPRPRSARHVIELCPVDSSFGGVVRRARSLLDT